MSLHLSCNIKELLTSWPYGAVRTLKALQLQGLYRQLAYRYVKSGWLLHYGSGAFARSGDSVDWLGGVYGLQETGTDVYVGGKTALELQGAAHFIPLSAKPNIHLYTQSNKPLPKWFANYHWNVNLHFYKIQLFPNALGLITYASQGFQLKISSPERAMMELLDHVPSQQSFDEANLLMEGLGTLRPQLVQQLLEHCKSIKVKRLFLFFAEHNNHHWLKDVNLSNVDLGTGYRSIVTGGMIDKKYKITVPKTFSKINIEEIP